MCPKTWFHWNIMQARRSRFDHSASLAAQGKGERNYWIETLWDFRWSSGRWLYCGGTICAWLFAYYSVCSCVMIRGFWWNKWRPFFKAETLTGDIQSKIDSRAGRRQTETHDNEDRRIRGDTHEHPEHHREGQRGQKGLGPAQPAGKHRDTDTRLKLSKVSKHRFKLTGIN